MHARNLDHARGILRKLETERKEWINRGVSMTEVDDYYAAKIMAARECIERFSGRGEEDVPGLDYRRARKKGHKERRASYN